MTVLSHLEMVALVISDFLSSRTETKSRRLVGDLRNLDFLRYIFKHRAGHNVISSSSSHKMEDKGLIIMGGEGRPTGWFFARNSGRKRKDMDPSGSYAKLPNCKA